MGPKKGSAKNQKKGSAPAVNKNWESNLIKAPFEEDTWKASISLLIGGSPTEEEVIQPLCLAVQKPQRKLFTMVTWDNMIEKINEFGNPKSKKPDNTPMFFEVTEPALVLLNEGKEINNDLMAKVLKFILLQIKAKDQQRRLDEQAELERKLAPPVEVKEKSGKHDKKGKGAPAPAPSVEKKTKLKRRDDVDPPVYIDDEPGDGPQHYILLAGFYQPQLIAYLNAVGVNIANIIKLHSSHVPTSDEKTESPTCETDQNPDGSQVVESDVDLKAKAMEVFWTSLRPILESQPPDSKLNDSVQLTYPVPKLLEFHPDNQEAMMEFGCKVFDDVAKLIYGCVEQRRQHQHYRDSMKLVQVARADRDAQPVEDLPPVPPTPLSKKKATQEAQAEKEAKPAIVSVDVDMRYYNNLLSLVSPEACSVPLMLHCMLEQVVISTDPPSPVSSPPSDESSSTQSLWLDQQLVGFMLQKFLPYLHTEEERLIMLNNLLDTVEKAEEKQKLMEKYGVVEDKPVHKKPLVIRYNDERMLRFRGNTKVHGFSPTEVEEAMMKKSLVGKMIQSVVEREHDGSCWKSMKQQLQYFCTDEGMSWNDVQNFLHLSVFESMNLTTLDCCGTLPDTRSLESKRQQSPQIVPWDNPLDFARQQLHYLQTKSPVFQTENPEDTKDRGMVCCCVDLSEIQSCRHRSLFEWHYTEHHDPDILPQVLQEASEHYRCLDTYRGRYNNILYIFCHNPVSSDDDSKEFWDVKLHTDVKFRRYMEHVMETISDWTKEEDLKRLEKIKKSQEPPEPPKEEEEEKPAEVPEEPQEPPFRKDSLKAWKQEQDRLKEEELAKKAKKESSAKGKKDKKETSPKGKKGKEKEKETEKAKEKDAKSSAKKGKGGDKKGKASAGSAQGKADGTGQDGNKDGDDESFSGFIGYNFDGEFIHVSGSTHNIYPSDGGHVCVEKTDFLEGSHLMKIAVKKDGHQIYSHISHIVEKPNKLNPTKEENKGQDAGQAKTALTVPKLVEVKTVKHGSFSALLDNNIRLAYSFYGPTGEYTDEVPESPQDAAMEELNPTLPTTVLESSVSPPDKEIELESIFSQASQEGEEPLSEPIYPFNSLSLSVPSGLFLQFILEDSPEVPQTEKNVFVRQSFPMHGQGHLDHHPDPTLSKELSRTITTDGTVIRYMRDGSTEILFADGSVSYSQDSGPVWVPDSELQKETEDPASTEEEKSESGYWCTTSLLGNRICTVGSSHEHIPTPSLLTLQTTDPVTREVMLTREDLLVSVQHPDGSQIVDHADGTRITTLLQNRLLFDPTHMFHRSDRSESPRSSSLWSSTGGHFVDSRRGSFQSRNTHELLYEFFGNHSDIESSHRGLSECGSLHNNLEKDAETGASHNRSESGKASSCRSHNENKVVQEKIMMVEREGCAMVVMYPERHSAHIVLSDGTLIIGNNNGEYEIFPSGKGFLHIHSDGKYVYSSDQHVSPNSKPCSITNVPGTYTMSHTGKIACEIADENGNHFQMTDDGEVSVRPPSCTSSIFNLDENGDFNDPEDKHVSFLKQKEHLPRLIMVHEDGSGIELLSSEIVEDLLQKAYFDPTIALLIEPLPDQPDLLVITILKPSHVSVWSQWLLSKQKSSITPLNLKNRSWDDFPKTEIQNKLLPPFGTNMGIGLTLREICCATITKNHYIKTCPDVLELRNLSQHRSMTIPLKDVLDKRIQAFIEILMEKEQHVQDMSVKDPRSEVERSNAENLLSLFLSLAEEDDLKRRPETKSIAPETMSRKYKRGIGIPVDGFDTSAYGSFEAFDFFKKMPSRESQLSWIEKITLHRDQISEEKYFKDALMKKTVLPYFDDENFELYKNMHREHEAAQERLSSDLLPIPEACFVEPFVTDSIKQIPSRPVTSSITKSHEVEHDKVPEERPTDHMPKFPGVSECRLRSRPRRTSTLFFDVTGKPRQEKITIPKYLFSSKPYTIPNEHFQRVEEPWRRKCHTVSLSEPKNIVRGFHLLPSSVDFGVVLAGSLSVISVTLKNIGVDACRFRVEQPPSSLGLRVIYNPGLVAAGMHTKLQVELFAMHVADSPRDSKRRLSQHIIIHTETDIHHLPVTAEFDSEVLFSHPSGSTVLRPLQTSKVTLSPSPTNFYPII